MGGSASEAGDVQMIIPRLNREDIVKRALSLVGTSSSFPRTESSRDCVDLALFAYDYQVERPSESGDPFSARSSMVREFLKISRWKLTKEPLPGDALFFLVSTGWHFGIFIGENRFVHAGNGAFTVGLLSRWRWYLRGCYTWDSLL